MISSPIEARTVRALLFLLSASCGDIAVAAVTPASGWQNRVVPAAAGGAFVGGLDFLPNGNVAVFDGSAIVEVSTADGSVVATLFTPAAPVFGSFVKTSPDGAFLLFGESSNHDVYRVPLDGSTASVVTNAVFNFDCAFASPTVAFLSAAPGAFGSTQVIRVDLTSGQQDVIADLVGASGPVALDGHGNLYYGENSVSFPPPAGQQSIRRFSAAQVASAVGPGVLTTAQSAVAVAGLTNPSDLVIDEEGDLFVSEGSDGTIRQYGPGGSSKGPVGEEAPFNSVFQLASFGTGAAGRFDAYQPATAGVLAAISTDFFTFNDLNLIEPRRPSLSTSPSSPIPDGPFSLDLEGGAPLGAALLLVAANPTPETLFDVGFTSYFFGVDVGQLAAVLPVSLDVAGTFHVPETNGPIAGTGTIQAVVIASNGAGVGTSNPLTVTLQ